MTLFDKNRQKLQELLPNCRDRALAFHDAAFPVVPFAVHEVYRSPETQMGYFTRGRTLADITSLYENKYLTTAQYKYLKMLYDTGKNQPGPQNTWTLTSNHIARRAFDCTPIITSNKDVEAKKRLAYAQLQQIGAKYGVFRPAATLAKGDFGHYEIIDTPLPTPDNNMLLKMAELRRQARIDAKLQPSIPPSL